MNANLKTSALLVAFFVAGCTIVPETIKVADTDNLVSFESIISGDETGQGAEARWGGEIVSVHNKKEYSELEILHFPSNHYGKPRTALDSAGRFKVRVSEFIDPLVFVKGRIITFRGELGEPAEGLIGEQVYVYPVLLANGYYMWKDTEEYEVSGFYYANMSPYWGLGLRSHFYRPYGFYHSRATVRVDTKRSKSGKPESKSPVSSGQRDNSNDTKLEQRK